MLSFELDFQKVLGVASAEEMYWEGRSNLGGDGEGALCPDVLVPGAVEKGYRARVLTMPEQLIP